MAQYSIIPRFVNAYVPRAGVLWCNHSLASKSGKEHHYYLPSDTKNVLKFCQLSCQCLLYLKHLHLVWTPGFPALFEIFSLPSSGIIPQSSFDFGYLGAFRYLSNQLFLGCPSVWVRVMCPCDGSQPVCLWHECHGDACPPRVSGRLLSSIALLPAMVVVIL